MTALHVILAFAGVQTLATVSPGPAFAIVTQKTLRGGQRAGFAAALGCAIGDGIWVASTIAGLTMVAARYPWLDLTLRVAGGLYLIYLGIKLWRHAGDALPSAADLRLPGVRSAFTDFSDALFVQLTNPKALAYCVSVLITILPSDMPLWLKIVIPLIGMSIEGAWWLFIASTFSSAKFRQRYATLKSMAELAIGGVLGFLGIKLLLELA